MTMLLEQDQSITRQRLLEAAGQVFADKGFRAATIRDICRRARANVAAVKYHFGDKEKLYAATVRYAHYCGAGNIADAASLPPDATSHDRLKAFARVMFTGLLNTGKPAWHGKLMAREMAEPTVVLRQIAEEGVKPRLRLLSEIIRTVIGADAPNAIVFRCARSIVGQILFYHFARPMLVRVFPDERFDASAVETLSEHVAIFSLGALREIAGTRTKASVT